jgi:hypothetical protein
MNDFTTENENTHVVDVDGIEEARNEALPKGWYNSVVAEHDYALSQASGQPMWTLKLQIQGGEYDGKTIYYHMSWSEKARPYTKAAMQTCFPDILANEHYRTPERKLDLKKIGDESAFCGRLLQVQLGHQTYDGEVRNNVRKIRPQADTNEFLGA